MKLAGYVLRLTDDAKRGVSFCMYNKSLLIGRPSLSWIWLLSKHMQAPDILYIFLMIKYTYSLPKNTL